MSYLFGIDTDGARIKEMFDICEWALCYALFKSLNNRLIAF